MTDYQKGFNEGFKVGQSAVAERYEPKIKSLRGKYRKCFFKLKAIKEIVNEQDIVEEKDESLFEFLRRQTT